MTNIHDVLITDPTTPAQQAQNSEIARKAGILKELEKKKIEHNPLDSTETLEKLMPVEKKKVESINPKP